MSAEQKTLPKSAVTNRTSFHKVLMSFIKRPPLHKKLSLLLLLLIIVLAGTALSMICRNSGKDTGHFSGDRAFSHVKEIVELGPRPSGSEALKKAGEYIKNKLAESGLEARDGYFTARTPTGSVAMNNITGVMKGAGDDILIIGTHYESKYFSSQVFVGANDGGSGTGVLLEAARVLSIRKEQPFTIWFVFFDGEEAFGEWSATDSLYGSRHFAEELKEKGLVPKVKTLLLLDMVGDRDLSINNDAYSTPWLRETMHDAAEDLGFRQYFNGPYVPIQDDHIPFLDLSIPSIDIIDMNFPWWHTPDDTLDKVSPASLEIVGLTLLRMIDILEDRFAH